MTRMAQITASFQGLGRSLMLPIAVLPIAGLLLRLGQPDIADPVAAVLPWVHLGFLAAAANAVFDNLGLLFAAGVAIGFARENHGAAALAALVGYFVATEGAAALVVVPDGQTAGLAPELAALVSAQFKYKAVHDLSVPIGIVTGIVSGYAYNRFHAIRLPEYLAFFGGRRFVPIVMGLFGVFFALLLGSGYSLLRDAITGLSQAVSDGGAFGLFLYGALNRLLIVTGLHHILNNVVWFILGDFHGATGDLRRFFAGDPTAGVFMAGFFPVMMFGLPAACLAMYHTARPERRKEVGGMLLSQGLTSFLTGVTEPVEFTFMFLAPALYALHMVFTGAAFVILQILDVKLGFSFSAGLFDFLINFGLATHPLRMLPVGLAFAVVYYVAFRWTIVRFNLKTPGRDDAAQSADATSLPDDEGQAWLAALGGAGNLVRLGACTTRLRLELRDGERADEAALRRLGARGIVRPAPGSIQVIVGPDADRLCGEIGRAAGAPRAREQAELSTPAEDVDEALARALGGPGNFTLLAITATRIVVKLKSPGAIREADLPGCGIKAWSWGADGVIHLIQARGASATAA